MFAGCRHVRGWFAGLVGTLLKRENEDQYRRQDTHGSEGGWKASTSVQG